MNNKQPKGLRRNYFFYLALLVLVGVTVFAALALSVLAFFWRIPIATHLSAIASAGTGTVVACHLAAVGEGPTGWTWSLAVVSLTFAVITVLSYIVV